MITEEEFLRFQALRKRLFDAIEKMIDEDPHHKSYEGAFDICMRFKNMFETEDRECSWFSPEEFVIKLDCYVIGPHRHYEWVGDSFWAALSRCERDLKLWIRECGAAE